MKTTRITLTALGVLALAACGGAGAGTESDGKPKVDHTDLEGNTYVIETVEGQEKSQQLMKDSKLSISFEKDGRIEVRTDCNQLSGDVDFEGDTMKADRLAGTLMGCEGEATKQEKWANDFITADPEWQLKGDTLHLIGDEATVTLAESDK